MRRRLKSVSSAVAAAATGCDAWGIVAVVAAYKRSCFLRLVIRMT